MRNPFIKQYKKHGLDKALSFLQKEYYRSKSIDIVEFIEFLAQNGENINDPEIAERILHYGTYPGGFYPEVFAGFVESGGDINVRDIGGNSLLICYISRFSNLSLSEVTELLVDTDKFYEAIKLFLELGVDPNNIGYRLTDKEPQKLSLITQIIHMIESIYERVPPKNLPDKLAEKIVQLIELAASYGADMNIPGYLGKTALHHASFPEIVSALLRYGADPNAKNLLFEATVELNCEKVRLLLEAGAEIKNSKNPESEGYPTLLFILVNRIVYGWRPIPTGEKDTTNDAIVSLIDLFVKYGINTEVKNSRGETAFALACDWRASKQNSKSLCERIDVFLKTLATAGADIDILDRHGKPAIETLPKDLQEELIKIAEYRNTVRAADDTDLDLYER